MSLSITPASSSSPNGSTTSPVGRELSTYPHALEGGPLDDASTNAFHNREHFITESWNLDTSNLHSGHPNEEDFIDQFSSAPTMSMPESISFQSPEEMGGSSVQNHYVPNFPESGHMNPGQSYTLSDNDYLELQLFIEQYEMQLARNKERENHENQYAHDGSNEESNSQISEPGILGGHYVSTQPTDDAKENDANERVKFIMQEPSSSSNSNEAEHEDSLQDININTFPIDSTLTYTLNPELPSRPIPQQNIAGSEEAVMGSLYRYDTDNHQRTTTVHVPCDQVAQPEFIEGSSNGTLFNSYLGQPNAINHHMAPARPDNARYTHLQPPSVTLGCPQSVPSSWSTSKRPREDGDEDAESTFISQPPRKRQYGRRQPPIPSAPTTSQLSFPSSVAAQTPSITISEIIPPPLEAEHDYRRSPPYVQVATNQYQCTYTGPIRLPQSRICGSENIRSGTRNRDRHVGTHAKREEEMISRGTMLVENAWALRWVTKPSVICSRCDFHVKTWRTDEVMENHEKVNHPEVHAERIAKRQAKGGKGRDEGSEEDDETGAEEGEE